METTKRKIKIRRQPKPIDVPAMLKLIEEAEVTFYMIEKHCKIGNGIVSRGLKEGTQRPIPPKWELPIIKYLKKKIAEKQDVELQTEEIKLEMGFILPEKESDLKEDLKELKRSWVDGLQG